MKEGGQVQYSPWGSNGLHKQPGGKSAFLPLESLRENSQYRNFPPLNQENTLLLGTMHISDNSERTEACLVYQDTRQALSAQTHWALLHYGLVFLIRSNILITLPSLLKGPLHYRSSCLLCLRQSHLRIWNSFPGYQYFQFQELGFDFSTCLDGDSEVSP